MVMRDARLRDIPISGQVRNATRFWLGGDGFGEDLPAQPVDATTLLIY